MHRFGAQASGGLLQFAHGVDRTYRGGASHVLPIPRLEKSLDEGPVSREGKHAQVRVEMNSFPLFLFADVRYPRPTLQSPQVERHVATMSKEDEHLTTMRSRSLFALGAQDEGRFRDVGTSLNAKRSSSTRRGATHFQHPAHLPQC